MAETEKPDLKEQVALLPLSPGVYQFVDRSGTIIYVGKAKSLRKRVSSYFCLLYTSPSPRDTR